MNTSESKSLPDEPDLTPLAISREGESVIQIQWNDGTSTRWTVSQLRAACPCATCREKKRGQEKKEASKASLSLPVLSAAEARPLRIESMRPVGSYAYQIAFSDGHSSGIFPIKLLANPLG
ncbi:hypothetical protein Pla52o_35810 [Novipirellula galeiformis]|uniref:Gamma-butyrobetaine hydroxylase-like N-terminal domain-containing protein n=1 Tax=Novipirellula galeiformis TaxID=2528004 RepID=A0A5C6CEJ5_9BACT|nr:DUF971 domain-containing protein [Novipirellula galeiformis]TWU22522.1 hypothetical protein Pla52o_35810 [Novipirellula galeiformis]